MTAFLGMDKKEKMVHICLSFDQPIRLETGCSKQERAVIDEFNRKIDEIFKGKEEDNDKRRVD